MALSRAKAITPPSTLTVVSVVAAINFIRPTYPRRNAADAGVVLALQRRTWSRLCSDYTEKCGLAGSIRNNSPSCNSAEPATSSSTAWLPRGPRPPARSQTPADSQYGALVVQENRHRWENARRHVWTELQGTSNRPASAGSGRRNCSPANRDQKPSAISTGQPPSCRSFRSPNARKGDRCLLPERPFRVLRTKGACLLSAVSLTRSSLPA